VRDRSRWEHRTYYAEEVAAGESDESLDEESAVDDGAASSLEGVSEGDEDSSAEDVEVEAPSELPVASG